MGHTFDRAFAAFGETYETQAGGSTNPDFAGLTQESMNGIFDTPNRNYHPKQGRWLTPDPAGIAAANPADPQSWNRYGYVGNSPLSAVDPSGLLVNDCTWTGGCGGWAGGSNGYYGGGGSLCNLDGLGVACNTLSGLGSNAIAYCPQCKSGDLVGADGDVYEWHPSLYHQDCRGGQGGPLTCGTPYLVNAGYWDIGEADP